MKKRKKVPAPQTFRGPFERTAKFKIWQIRQWGGEANCIPYDSISYLCLIYAINTTAVIIAVSADYLYSI